MKSKFIPDANGECASLSGGLTNRVEVRVPSREELAEAAKPKHKVVVDPKAYLIQQLHDRVLICKSSRTVDTPGLRKHWMLRTMRPWHCNALCREIQPGEIIECHDAVDWNNLTADHSDGALCETIEEVQR